MRKKKEIHLKKLVENSFQLQLIQFPQNKKKSLIKQIKLLALLFRSIFLARLLCIGVLQRLNQNEWRKLHFDKHGNGNNSKKRGEQ